MMLAAIGVRAEVFAAVFDPPHRTAEPHRQPAGAYLLGQQDSLVAKAAADIGRYDPDLGVIEAETFGKARAHDVRQLRRRMEDELPEPGMPLRDQPAPFDRRHALARGAQYSRDLYRSG